MQRNPAFAATHRRALAVALLVFCFVAAESFSVVHALDEAAHTGDGVCKICVGAASFAAAATAPPVPQLVVVAASAEIGVRPPLVAAARAVPLRPPARAPPVLS